MGNKRKISFLVPAVERFPSYSQLRYSTLCRGGVDQCQEPISSKDPLAYVDGPSGGGFL